MPCDWGDGDIAESKAKELYARLNSDGEVEFHMAPTNLILEFLTGKLTEPQFLDATAGSREARQNALLWIALRHLSLGNKPELREALAQLAPRKSAGILYSSLWGWAMRKQLNASPPKWPGWLGVHVSVTEGTHAVAN